MKKEISSSKREKIAQYVEAGDVNAARREILALNPRHLPKEHLLTVAKLARRVGLNYRALTLLAPCVRRKKPSDRETMEYAYNLLRVGARHESRQWLDKVSKASPELQLLQATIHLSAYEHTAAIKILEPYLRQVPLESRERQLARISLAGSYAFQGNYARVRDLLEPLHEEASVSKDAALLVSVLQLLLQAAWQTGNELETRKILQALKNQVVAHSPSTPFVYEKWEALIAAKEKPKKAAEVLEPLRREAYRRNEFETARGLDFHQAVLTADHELARKVFMGTPYFEFRKKLQRDFPGKLEIPNPFFWDLSLGNEDVAQLHLKFSSRQKPMRLLFEKLTSDFYRPQGLAGLVEAVFPGVSLEPIRHAKHMAKLTKQFQGWIKEQEIPLIVFGTNQVYRLSANEPCVLWLKQRPKAIIERDRRPLRKAS